MKLPQCEIIYRPALPEREILFVSGGRRPNKNWFVEVAKDRKIFCADKGIELCRACNILPKILVGDFDSAENSALAWAVAKKIPVERHAVDKNLTDTQLVLERAESLEKNFCAIMTGSFGGRADHLFSTIFTCAASKRKIFLADEREIIFYVSGGENVDVNFFRKPLALSLLPTSEICGGVKISGTHWELDGTTLAQNFPTAVSNRVEDDKIKISVDNGTLAIYFCFDENFSADNFF